MAEDATTSETVSGGGGADTDTPLPIPNLQQQQCRFILSDARCSHLHQQAAQDLLSGIEKDEMGPYLASLLTDSNISPHFEPIVPPTLLQTLQIENTKTLEELSRKLQDAREHDGETEVCEILCQKAFYLAQIGEDVTTVKNAFEEALLDKTKTGLSTSTPSTSSTAPSHQSQSQSQSQPQNQQQSKGSEQKGQQEQEQQQKKVVVLGLGKQIDLGLALIRVGMFWNDDNLIKQQHQKVAQLIEKGGDWERRNRLKVYQGVYELSIRQFEKGTPFLLDALSTFTATELISYEDFVSLAMIGSALTLSRKDLKKKVIESSEVIQVSTQRPQLFSLITSLYECSYDKFFVSLAAIEQDFLIPSRWLSPHTKWYIREMRVKGYAQLLESYRSLELTRIASAFGVTVEFMDSELSRFIAAGRLTCSIDRVSGIVETNRVDGKNAMYAAIVKNGDSLLNAIQKLSRVVA